MQVSSNVIACTAEKKTHLSMQS